MVFIANTAGSEQLPHSDNDITDCVYKGVGRQEEWDGWCLLIGLFGVAMSPGPDKPRGLKTKRHLTNAGVTIKLIPPI